MRISDHFNQEEFECRCGCGMKSISPLLVEVLEITRNHLGGFRININSGCRCPEHNKAVGGADDSFHLRSMAADIWIAEVDPHQVYDFLDKKFPDKYGVGDYMIFTHLDVRPYPARWSG